jgi:hypothetical protein
MMDPTEADPKNWRTWPRAGWRLRPPPGATAADCLDAMQPLADAAWGVDLNRSPRDRRNVVRLLKRVAGKCEEVSYCRVLNGKRIPVRVRGGCR